MDLMMHVARCYVAALLVTSAVTIGSAGATLYAASSGSGRTCSSSAPCTVSQALRAAAAGDTILLNDGVYTGVDGMVTPPPNKKATSSSPITVQALNDGQVLIDGQGLRQPCKLDGNDYWVLRGFDCAHSVDGVLTVVNSHHTIIRRLCAWDAADDGNNQVAIIWKSHDVLVEDSCFFGIGVAAFLDYDDTGATNANNIYRRLWLRGEGYNQFRNPGTANQFNYTGANFSGPALIENIISIIGGTRAKLQYGTNWLRHNAVSPYVRFYGGIHYYSGGGPCCSSNGLTNDGGYSGIVLQDQIVHANGLNEKPYVLRNGESERPVQSRTAMRITSVRGALASTYGTYTVTNAVEATTVRGTGFDYRGANNTAKLCFRYDSGIYTSTPLWPWPMDNRIKAAIAMNAARGSRQLAGSAGFGYGANTVSSEIASLFGRIPSRCNATTPPATHDFPQLISLTAGRRADRRRRATKHYA